MGTFAPHSDNISLGHFVDLYELPEHLLLFLNLVVITVYFCVTQILYFVFRHETILHPAFNIIDLKLLATFGHKLMLVETCVISDSMLLTFVKMIKWERSFVRRGCLLSFSTASVCS